MKKLLIVIAVILVGLLVIRFNLGGDEDTWICQNGQWVKHGNPSAARPEEGCGAKAKVVEETKEKLGDISKCVSQNGSEMTYVDAIQIAKTMCTNGSLKEEHICNDYTGTWWIDFAPSEPKEGCNPACVVNVETKQAEINWRCTGLIEEN